MARSRRSFHEGGSATSPTASLTQLASEGVEFAFVTLHVGLGTFAPLTPGQLEKGELHAERYSIPDETIASIEKTKHAGKPVIAVGTTVVRALESAFKDPHAIIPSGSTTIFIRPGFDFRAVDGLVTNFHVPKSSLLMLVDAFLLFKKSKRTLSEVYAHAISGKYRFFSFGDGMVVL